MKTQPQPPSVSHDNDTQEGIKKKKKTEAQSHEVLKLTGSSGKKQLVSESSHKNKNNCACNMVILL